MVWHGLSRLLGLRKAANALAVGCALIAFSGRSFGQIPCSYEVQIVPPIDCGFGPAAGNPTGMNNLGHVIGTFLSCGEPYTWSFLWTGGPAVQILPLPPGGFSFAANDISDDGLIVGTAQLTGLGLRAFIYNTNTGQWTQLPPVNPEIGWSQASAINSAGVICGERSIRNDVAPFNAMIWSPSGGFLDLGVMTGPYSSARAISENGYVCGWTGNTVNLLNAFRWMEGKLEVLGPVPGCTTSSAGGIASNGQTVGSGRTTFNGISGVLPFTYSEGEFVVLPTLPPAYPGGGATDINEQLLIVGSCHDLSPTKQWRGVMWYGNQIWELNAMLNSPDDVIVTRPIEINENGAILTQAKVSQDLATAVLIPNVRIPGDANCDQQVNVDDLLAVINTWGPCAGCVTDFTADGSVSFDDLFVVIQGWTQGR